MPTSYQPPVCAAGNHSPHFHHPTLVLLVLDLQETGLWCLGEG